MSQRMLFGISAIMVLGLALLPRSSSAQQGTISAQQGTIKEQIVGAWTLVAVIGERPDGTKFEPFGPNPKGIIIFTSDGHFSLFQSSAEVPKLVANDRARATPDEATAVVRESIAYYGTYTANEAEKTLAVKLDASTYANLVGGPEQKRIIMLLTTEELKFTNPRTPAGVVLLTAWKRAKAP